MIHFDFLAILPTGSLGSVSYHGLIQIEDIYGGEDAGDDLEKHYKGENGSGKFPAVF